MTVISSTSPLSWVCCNLRALTPSQRLPRRLYTLVARSHLPTRWACRQWPHKVCSYVYAVRTFVCVCRCMCAFAYACMRMAERECVCTSFFFSLFVYSVCIRLSLSLCFFSFSVYFPFSTCRARTRVLSSYRSFSSSLFSPHAFSVSFALSCPPHPPPPSSPRILSLSAPLLQVAPCECLWQGQEPKWALNWYGTNSII